MFNTRAQCMAVLCKMQPPRDVKVCTTFNNSHVLYCNHRCDRQEMINEVDADGSGSIDFSEFLNMMSKKVEETSVIEDQVRRAFKVLATTGKGTCIVLAFKLMATTTGKHRSIVDQ